MAEVGGGGEEEGGGTLQDNLELSIFLLLRSLLGLPACQAAALVTP